MVQVAVAGDVAEAEELQDILRAAGISAELQAAQDEPLTVLVPEASIEAAKDAIESLTSDDEIVADP
jgi:type III secretory pathway lipoprotein EscJ